MKDQLEKTTFDPTITELIGDIHETVVYHRGLAQDVRDSMAHLSGLESKIKNSRYIAQPERQLLDELGVAIGVKKRIKADQRKDILHSLKKLAALEVERQEIVLASLEEELNDRVEDLDRIRFALINDLVVSDAVLKELGCLLSKRLALGETSWQYRFGLKCKSCEDSGNEIRQERSRLGLVVPSSDYVPELEFRKALANEDLPPQLDPEHFSLVARDFLDIPFALTLQDLICRCEKPYSVVNTVNLIQPSRRHYLIDSVHLRVKSGGRYCEKLRDILFYDKNDPRMNKRSLFDKYAFTLLVHLTPEFQQSLQYSFGNRKFRSKFEKKFGVKLPLKADHSDYACYAALASFCDQFGIENVNSVQNGILDPIKRLSKKGTPEYYKMLQFHFSYRGKTFEGQIKTVETYNRERDRKSAICHYNYEQAETELRNSIYMGMPEAHTVLEFLLKIFRRDKWQIQ